MAEGGPAAQEMPLDSGLLAFVSILRFLGKPADPAQLRNELSPDGENFTAEHILRAAKRLEVKARRERTPSERLEKAALPAIALMKDGTFALPARDVNALCCSHLTTCARRVTQLNAILRPDSQQPLRRSFDLSWHLIDRWRSANDSVECVRLFKQPACWKSTLVAGVTRSVRSTGT